MNSVLVSGCFDLLHPGHVAFLIEAASYGELHVCAGSDQNVFDLKGQLPMFSEDERVYMLNGLESVANAQVSSGTGMLDFEPDLVRLKPTFFVVNHDGHTAEKRALCAREGVDYIVLERTPADGLEPRSSSGIKAELGQAADSKAPTSQPLPYRLCLAGGWLDQPWMSELCAGPVVVVQIEPQDDFIERAGLATSTRRTAENLWPNGLPDQDPQMLARMLFAYENQPGAQYVSGSQDALGLMLGGANKLNFNGGYWPVAIESLRDESTSRWLSSVIHLVPVGPRPEGYEPLAVKQLSAEGVARLASAGELAWHGIQQQSVHKLGRGMSRTLDAWCELLPSTVSPELQHFRAQYDEFAGSCFSGSGGGYLIVISEDEVPHATPIQVKRD